MPYPPDRRKRECVAKRLYARATPYLQIAGYLPVLTGILTLLYMITSFITDTRAYGGRITALQTQFAEEQLAITDMKADQGNMKIKIDDIHSYLLRGVCDTHH